MSGKKILSVFIGVILLVSIVSGCTITPMPVEGEVKGLVNYRSYSDIIQLLKNSQKESYKFDFFGRTGLEVANEAEDSISQDASSKSGSYSKTNIQVEGVDEADIVKTDGEYLYVLANGRLYIVDANDPEDMQIVSTLQYQFNDDPEKNTVYPIEMYLDEANKKLTIIANSMDNQYTLGMNSSEPQKDIAMAPDMYYWGYGTQTMMIQVIDISDIENPLIEREYLQEGSYLSSRRIGEYVYIITNKYSYYLEENEDFIFPATKEASLDGDWETLPVESIYVAQDTVNSSFVIISGIDTTDSEKKASTKAILGSGSNIYVTPENLYIANARYEYEENSDVVTNETSVGVDDVVAKGDEPVSSDSDAKPVDVGAVTEKTFIIITPPTYEVFTDIFKFDIANGEVTATQSGQVPGYILNQFAMDEYDGNFRIATTTGDSWREDEFTSMNNVYILDDGLEIIGRVEGLATRETIKSVRFLGEMAYMVTFRTTDPLFVLDLSVPTNPQVKGELKIPGYSQYLHPISDTILVGFGREAIEENDRAIELGIKLSVFDVSDVSNPKEISTMIIGDMGSYSEVLYNHKALMYSKEQNILGFPITIYEKVENSSDYYYTLPEFSGFMLVGLDEDNKLFEKGRVGHFDFEIVGNDVNNPEYWKQIEKYYALEQLYRVERGMFIEQTLFTISNASIKANSLVNYNSIGSLELPGFEDANYYYFDGQKGIPEGGIESGEGVDPERGEDD